MLQALVVLPAQLLLAGPLILTWLYRHAPWSYAFTPRSVSTAYHPTNLTTLSYGITYAISLLIFVIGLTYSCIAPLILPFCALYFGIATGIFKYLLLYVHAARFETGGKFAPMATRRGIVGVALMQVTMMAVLAIKYGGSSNGGETRIRTKNAGVSTADVEPSVGGWSNYAQMVIGVVPLLICTAALVFWMNSGYDHLVEHMPMELIGKLVKK